MASTSRSRVEESASTSGRSYDVFINHRGPDVKHTLAAKIYNMLTCGMGLRVFLDDKELELGDDLPGELDAAIKSASLHIAIFSENYAQSRWCLDELKLMRKTGTKIVPIFFHVKPEDVRHAKGTYAVAFEQHRKKRRHTPRTIREWKEALFHVSNNIGHIVENEGDEDTLLTEITYCVTAEIKKVPLVVAEHVVGLDEIVEDFKLTALQSDGSCHNVQMVGIWGMGGSGKTTLAKKLYNNIYPSMDRASLILDVRDSAKKNLLFEKQKKLLQDLGFKNVSVNNIEEGKAILASNLRSVRALIVLDDVDHVDQLNALLPGRGSVSLIGSGTTIIVTTRELDVLKKWKISSRYKMKSLSAVHAKQLFCWHAFSQPSPKNGFEKLVEKFLEACSGLPLSLKVLGGQLLECSKDSWEGLLKKISRKVHKDIMEILKISYDTLDDEEKDTFLDIACFFIGEKRDLAIEVWNGLPSSGLNNLEKLRNKCLVEIDEENYIRMHDHLRDMGKEIANRKSPHRLWSSQQNIEVCNEEIGIGVRGINATTAWEFEDCSSDAKLMINTTRGVQTLVPSKLGLKFVVAHGCNLNHVISGASKDLVWLRWLNSRQANLQSILPSKNLRVLEVSESYAKHLRELWVDECDVPSQLRELVINECSELQGIPKSIGRLKQLRKIVLYRLHLKRLPEELGLLQSLEHLEIKECQKLLSLPKSMGNLRNLRHLSLYGCTTLPRLPDSCKELILLQHLDLSSCSHITFRADIMEKMSMLKCLKFSSSIHLTELPRHIINQASLRELDICDMPKLRKLPVKIGQLNKLQKLLVAKLNSLTSLPASLGDMSSLTELQIIGCWNLQCIPDSVGRLSLLKKLEIESVGVKSLPESINQLINLETLKIGFCSSVSELDLGAGSSSSSLFKLKSIDLLHNYEMSKVSIPKDCCTGLETLTIEDNDNLTEIESLPSSLRKLVIRDCPKLSALPSFAELISLREFVLKRSYQVKKIEGLDHCRDLEVMKAYTWCEVPCIQSLGCIERLRTVHITAMRKSAVEGCIQSQQKCPGEIIVCTQAVDNAASIVNPSAFPTLSVVDSCSDEATGIYYCPELKAMQPTNGNAIIVCFVVSTTRVFPSIWVSIPRVNQSTIWGLSIIQQSLIQPLGDTVEVKEGRWVWIGVFTQRSQWYSQNLTAKVDLTEKGFLEIFAGNVGRVEKGFIAMVEEDRAMEALHGLVGLMGI